MREGQEHALRREAAAPRSSSRLRIMSEAAGEVLRRLFAEKMPADRTLGDFFRTHRQCGSRDRAAISRGVYALLRYWGWWRRIFDRKLLVEVESGSGGLYHREVRSLLWAALFTEGGYDPEELERFRGELELPRPSSGDSILDRGRNLFRAWGVERMPGFADLIPEALRDALPDEEGFRERFSEGLSRRPPLWLRMQKEPEAALAELKRSGAAWEEHPVLKDAVAVTGRLDLRGLESFRCGRIEVQDLASQCIGRIAAPRKGERWFDPCAGAGGKTLQLASLMEGKGTVAAGDVRESALEELRQRVRRAGFQNVTCRLHDGHPHRGMHSCDGVLVDAPCSGSGVWRRSPGNQWHLTPEAVEEFARRQLEILRHFSSVVRPGGTLVYATCSVFPRENEEVVRAFLVAEPQFVLDPFASPLEPGRMMPGMMRISPADGDTMFAARMRRRAE